MEVTGILLLTLSAFFESPLRTYRSHCAKYLTLPTEPLRVKLWSRDSSPNVIIFENHQITDLTTSLIPRNCSTLSCAKPILRFSRKEMRSARKVSRFGDVRDGSR